MRVCARTVVAGGRKNSRAVGSLPSPARELSPPHPEPFRFESLLAMCDDLVDEAVLLGLHRRHDSVALNVALDLVEGLARVLGDDARSQLAHANYLFGLNLDVAGLPA